MMVNIYLPCPSKSIWGLIVCNSLWTVWSLLWFANDWMIPRSWVTLIIIGKGGKS
jgi:hypothetical protein